MNSTPNPYPIDPTGPLTMGSIPDADLDRLIAATIPDDNIPLPGGWNDTDAWQHDEHGDYRIIYGTIRGVPGRPDITVRPTALQLADGTIDNGSVIEGPCVHVDGVGGEPLTIDQGRRLAAAIMAAADDLAALSPDPAYPLDGVSLGRILDEITRRMASSPGTRSPRLIDASRGVNCTQP